MNDNGQILVGSARCAMLAERVGFEPTVVFYATLVFKTSAINRSATSPSA